MEDDEDADKAASEEGNTNDNVEEGREESPVDDIVIEVDYYEQEEELDYEDDAPNEEDKQNVEVDEGEQATDMEERLPAI